MKDLTEIVFETIREELEFAKETHPDWPEDIIHAAAIVAEEAGELIQSAIDCVYHAGPLDHLKLEAIQTAAMAIRLLMNLGGDKK